MKDAEMAYKAQKIVYEFENYCHVKKNRSGPAPEDFPNSRVVILSEEDLCNLGAFLDRRIAALKLQLELLDPADNNESDLQTKINNLSTTRKNFIKGGWGELLDKS